MYRIENGSIEFDEFLNILKSAAAQTSLNSSTDDLRTLPPQQSQQALVSHTSQSSKQQQQQQIINNNPNSIRMPDMVQTSKSLSSSSNNTYPNRNNINSNNSNNSSKINEMTKTTTNNNNYTNNVNYNTFTSNTNAKMQTATKTTTTTTVPASTTSSSPKVAQPLQRENSTELLKNNMKLIFEQFDKDNDGKITKHELNFVMRNLFPDEVITEQDIKVMLIAADLDNNGFIDFEGKTKKNQIDFCYFASRFYKFNLLN